MQVLVIGGTGPTGLLIVDGLLQRGYRVTILHRGMHEVEPRQEVEHIHADPHFIETLREGIGTRCFDLVIGMYGRLRHVAEVIKGHTPYFIAVGGIPYRDLVLGDKNPEGVPVLLREDAPLVAQEGESKFNYLMAISERTVMEACHRGDYEATILRFPLIYGPRQVVPREWSIIRRILDGRKQLIMPDGGLKLERKGYAENVAHAVLLCVDQPREATGKTFNVGDEQVLSLRNWACIVAAVMGYQFELVSVPFFLAKPTRAYTGPAFHQVTDIGKIKQELGYRDQVSPQEGIRRTVDWYLEHRPSPGGEIEQRLQDPFDYTAEDHLIREYRQWSVSIRQAVDTGFRWRHAYDHPASPLAHSAATD